MNILTIVLGVIILVVVVVVALYLFTRSKGKINISLDKFEFSPGETISGTIALKLKKEVQAKSLNVGLVGKMKQTDYGGVMARDNTYRSSTRKVFDFKKPIDGEKVYGPGDLSYKFNLVIPKDVYRKSTGNQLADTMIKSAQLLAGTTSRIKWFVTANLEMPGFDVSKKVAINIT